MIRVSTVCKPLALQLHYGYVSIVLHRATYRTLTLIHFPETFTVHDQDWHLPIHQPERQRLDPATHKSDCHLQNVIGVSLYSWLLPISLLENFCAAPKDSRE